MYLVGNYRKIQQNDYTVQIIKIPEEVEKIRDFWTKTLWHPEADIDVYLTSLKLDPELVRPHLVTLSKNGQLSAIVLGRIRDMRFAWNIGYKTVHTTPARSLEILYGGLLGELSHSCCTILLNRLINSLYLGDADILSFNSLKLGTPMHQLTSSSPFLYRDHFSPHNMHWQLDLPNTFDEWLRKLSKSTRRGIRVTSKRLKKEFGDKLQIRCLRHRGEIDLLMSDIEKIASKTYHRGLGQGFIDNALMRATTEHYLRHQWQLAYILYIDDKPCAFWNGLRYGKTFFAMYTGYVPEYRELNLGTFLLAKIIEEACMDQDIKTIDFGFGDAEYKRRYSNQNWHESSVHIFAPTFKGLRLKGMRTLTAGVDQSAKRVLGRLEILQRVKTRWRQRMTPQ